MTPKPRHLNEANAGRFKEQSIVDRYHLRLPYPPEIFEFLNSLITDEPRHLLDVGTGLGELARAMVARVARVDGVDFSQAMLERAKTLPNGDNPNLRWLGGAAETIELSPPYALIMAGDSLHWMNWEVIFPRFRQMLTPNGYVAIVHRSELPPVWEVSLKQLILQYAPYGFAGFDLIKQLEERGLYQSSGQREFAPITLTQTLENYIASMHSRSYLSIDYLGVQKADAFDNELKEIIMPYSQAGRLQLQTLSTVEWGKPL